MRKPIIWKEGLDISLRAVINDRLEVNFHSAVYHGMAAALDERSVVIRLLNNDLSRLLSANMKCVIEFEGCGLSSAMINNIESENGWLVLKCGLLKKEEG